VRVACTPPTPANMVVHGGRRGADFQSNESTRQVLRTRYWWPLSLENMGKRLKRTHSRRNIAISCVGKIRFEIWETLDNPDHSEFAKLYSLFLMLLIVVCTISFVLESEATIDTGVLYGTGVEAAFFEIERVSVIIFSLEYVLRLLCCPYSKNRTCGLLFGVVHFVTRPANIIDLLACLPFWITQAMGGGSGLSFVRAVRLMRIFRVFKASKYTVGLRMFAGALSASFEALAILIFSISLAVVILSSIMYLLEGRIGVPNVNASEWETELLLASGSSPEMQHFCFGTIPRAFWWSVVAGSMT